MPRFLIQAPHTQEECLQALDEVLAQGPQVLATYDWGCNSGDHTGYAVLEAMDQVGARNAVPGAVRQKARIVEVGKFTPEQIKGFHKGL